MCSDSDTVVSRFVRRRGIAARSLWLACGVALAAIAALLVLPGSAAAILIVDDAYDFSLGPLGWTATPVGILSPPPADPAQGARWTHATDFWSVNWSPVPGPLVGNGNWLTSPPIDGSDQSQGAGGGRLIDLVRISVAHRFDFGTTLAPPPLAAGQVVYSINGNPFQGIPDTAWLTGTLASPVPVDPFGASPLWPTHVTQQALVAPSFTPPVGAYSSLFPLLNGGASFTGSTPGYTATGGAVVPSVAVLDIPPVDITSFEVRLINANLSSSCTANAGWDVGYLQVDFATPEPTLVVPAVCVALAGAGLRLCRRRTREPEAGT